MLKLLLCRRLINLKRQTAVKLLLKMLLGWKPLGGMLHTRHLLKCGLTTRHMLQSSLDARHLLRRKLSR
jgi:hypothetical protein